MFDIEILKKYSGAKLFREGEIIAKEGDTGGAMFILLSGEVGAYKNYGKENEIYISTLLPGDFFGEMTLFLGKSLFVSFVVNADAVIIDINRDNVLVFIRQQPEATFEIIRSICTKLDGGGRQTSRPAQQAAFAPKPAPQVMPPAPPVPATANTQTSVPVPPAPPVAPKPAQPDTPTAAPVQSDAPPKAVSKPETKPKTSKKSALFPEGHGDYELSLNNADAEYIYEKTVKCPICKKEFRALTVRASKLMTEKIDPDMRARYKGIEPMHYDIYTCPDCLYSAPTEIFQSGLKSKEFMAAKLEEYKPEFKAGMERDTDTVFLSYYLALTAVKFCFRNPQLNIAKLWLKLSRLYSDCGDADMELFAVKNALENYMFAYEKLDLPESQSPQLCTMIGEMYNKTGDIKNARSFFFKVKTHKQSTPVLKDHADDRINELRDAAAAVEEI